LLELLIFKLKIASALIFRVVLNSEKDQVESYTNLLCLDNDLDLLYSLLKETKDFLTKEKALELMKYTVNLDTNLRKSIALQRSCLFQAEETAENEHFDGVQDPQGNIPEITVTTLQQTVPDGPSSSGSGDTSPKIRKLQHTFQNSEKPKSLNSQSQPVVVHLAEKEKTTRPAGLEIKELRKRRNAQRKQ